MKKILFFFFLPILSYSQTLDPTFHLDGIRTDQVTNIPTGQYAYDAALQPDGKIVYVGRFVYPFINSFAARYNVDESKDDTFNQYGFKKFASLGFQTLAIQPDGSLLFAGRSEIVRVLSNGDSDLTFNSTGAKTIDFNGQPMNIKCISVQSDNKIVLSGYVSTGNNDFIIVRLNSDGSFDTSFDTDGILTLAFGSGNDEAFSHKIQNDGKIVVFGQAHNGTDYDFALARINTNGTTDPFFGSAGKVITPFASGNDFSRSGEVLSDGRILLLGVSGGKFALTKYLDNGTLDTSFSGDGKLLLNDNCSTGFVSNATTFHGGPKLKMSLDGKILIAGTSDNNFKIIRLHVDGTYDNSFDTDGVFIADNAYDSSAFLAERQDGTILSGGISQTAPSIDIHTVKIKEVKVYPGGSNRMTNIDLYYAYDQLSTGAFRLSDQSTIVATTTHRRINPTTTKDVIIIEKLLANGNLDTNYGTFGYLQIESNSFYMNSKVTKVLQLPDNSTILKGSGELYKITPSGLLDTTFGSGGVLTSVSINPDLGEINDIILSNDYKLLLICDQAFSATAIQTAVIKLNLDGTKDTSFGTNGIVGYGFSNHANDGEWPNALYQDANNKIIVTSESHMINQPGTKLCLSKLNSDGTFDTTFGTNGIFIYDHTPEVISHTITQSSDNNYLINFSDPSLTKSYTLKVNNNGTVDTAFGLNGESSDVTGSYNKSMIMQADGKFIKAGYHGNQLSISRYNTDGTLDTGFGVNGEINTYTGYESVIESIQLQSDGKLMAVGNSFDGDSRHVILLRYINTTLGTLDLESNKNALLVYPNPIENSTTFEYTLTDNETVTITLFDLQGKEVKKVVTNQPQQAGKHSLPINLEGMATGNYILKIASGKGSQSLQLLRK